MEWFYSVTVIRNMSSLEDGHLWSDMLPDELHQEKYNFDGWEAEMRSQGPVSYIDNDLLHADEKKAKLWKKKKVKVQTYELFWYPKTFELAQELLAVLNGMKEHTLFEGCDFKLTIVPKTW